MLQGRNNDHVRQRRGGLVPGQVPTRVAKFKVRHGRKITEFDTLGRRDVLHSAIAFAHEVGGTVQAVWDEK